MKFHDPMEALDLMNTRTQNKQIEWFLTLINQKQPIPKDLFVSPKEDDPAPQQPF